MQKDIIKRQRSQNWLNEDKVILKNLIKERIQIIANKSTDSNTNKKKEKAWDDILNNFNKTCIGVTRTIPQVKAQWCFMKMHVKKTKAEKRKELTKAGGSLSPSSQTQTNEIPVWLPTEVKIEIDDSDTKKKTVASPSATQSPAAQVAAVETECRHELHRVQMKVASLQVANEEEHKSRILHLEEDVQQNKIEYYKRKMQYYSSQNKR